MMLRDLPQNTAASRLRGGKSGLAPERTVGNHGDPTSRTPGNHGMFNGSFFQMVEDLIADRRTRDRDGAGLFEIFHIEIAHAP